MAQIRLHGECVDSLGVVKREIFVVGVVLSNQDGRAHHLPDLRVAEQLPLAVEQLFVLFVPGIQRFLDELGLCRDIGRNIEVHGHQIQCRQVHSCVDEGGYGVEAVGRQARRACGQGEGDGQRLPARLHFILYLGDGLCASDRGFAVAIKIVVFNIEVDRSDMIPGDDRLICLFQRADRGALPGELGALLAPETDGDRAIGAECVGDAAVDVKLG